MELTENKKVKNATTTTIPNPNQNQTKVLNRSPESQTHPKPHNKLCTTTTSSQQTGWSMISHSSDYEEEEVKEQPVIIDQKKLAKLRYWFDRFHKALLDEIYPQESHHRPVPPVLGPNGGSADLFKLFVVVRGKGGCESVTRRGLWASVAGELGLGLEFSAAVKLVYAKYLDAFERWVDRGVDVVRELYAMNGDDCRGVCPLSRKRKSDDCESECGLTSDCDDGDCEKSREALVEVLGWVRGVAREPRDASLPEPSKWNNINNIEESFNGGDEIWKKVLMAREALFLKRNNGEQQKYHRMHPSMYMDKHGSAYNLRERRKTRRRLLNGGSDSQEAGSESSPATSDFDRNLSGSEDRIDSMDSLIYSYGPSRIPTGPAYQAEVPEWTGRAEPRVSNSKWLGTKVWPLEKTEKNFLVERDPIGKGRHESCGCEEPGSLECVRFHVAEKRLRVKRELSSAFYLWRFNRMGEEVRMLWTTEEEKKFKETVSSNLTPLRNSFWDQIFKAFPYKSRADLVSYYYNVYILSRRARQNRFSPGNIDSDDEEFEDVSVTNGGCGGDEVVEKKTPDSKKSILLTPNKQHRK